MLKLTLNESRAEDISHGTKMLKLKHHSRTKRIALDEVEDLNVEDSVVEEMTISVAKSSTITNSELTLIKRMDLVGDSVFLLQSSNISTIQALNYASINDSSMNDVNVERVFSHGIIISQGSITMENVVFENLGSNAIVVTNGSRVVIRNSVINNAQPDSWITENGSTEFVDVLVNNKHNFSLKADGSPLNPLRLVIDCPPSLLYWVAPVITVLAILFGFLAGGGVMFFLCAKRFSFGSNKPNREEMTPLNKNPGKKSNDVALKISNTSSPPSQKGSLEEYYELYEDVQNVGPKLQPPGNNRGFQRKPSPQLPGLKKNVSPQISKDDDSDELYEDVSVLNNTSPIVQSPPPLPRGQPKDSYPKLPSSFPPPLPQSSSPSVLPSPKVGPPLLPARNPPSPLVGNPVQGKDNKNSRPPPPPSPYDPSKFSVQSSSSSVVDERDNLPPPPPPQDNQEFYDDTDSILPNSPSKRSFASDKKSSFLHHHSPTKPNPPVKPFVKPQPLGNMLAKFSSAKSPPRVPLEKPVPPKNQKVDGNDDDDDEALYEEI